MVLAKNHDITTQQKSHYRIAKILLPHSKSIITRPRESKNFRLHIQKKVQLRQLHPQW